MTWPSSSSTTLRAIIRTMPRPFGAAAMAEYAVIGSAVFASFYVAACVTSFTLAAGQAASMQNMLITAAQMRIESQRGWLMPSLATAAARSARR